MQFKRRKRSRNRAAKDTAGHGSKKKNRGAGHRGGRGKSGSGKRGDFKLMKVTKGLPYLGKHGFNSLKKSITTINLADLQERAVKLQKDGIIKKDKEFYIVDLKEMGYQKLLSKGPVWLKLDVKVDQATQNAVSKIEAAGGKVQLLAVK